MFTVLDNRRDLGAVKQDLLDSLLRDCQQSNQTLLNELLQYYFQTESSHAFGLIKQFVDCGKDQTKILLEQLNNHGLKQNYRHSSSLSSIEAHQHDEQEKVAHLMKVFRILCLMIHRPIAGLGTLIKDSLLLTNSIQAITRCKDDPNILAQGCYFFAALTATLPGEIGQQTEAILNIYKATCKYLWKNVTALRQISIQTNTHSLENVQLWIVNQSAHALFYMLYTAYPCNFLLHIQKEFQRNENAEVFEQILFPMFQRVRFNPRLIDSDKKRETEKERRVRQDSSQIVYESRKLSLDQLFGREPSLQRNWMHQEMKKILPFTQFKRQTPSNSIDQLFDGHRTVNDVTTPVENITKRSSNSPFQKFKEKLKSLVRTNSSSSPSTTVSTPDASGTLSAGFSNNAHVTNSNTLILPNASASILTTPTLNVINDIRAVRTMPELQKNDENSSSLLSPAPNIQRSDRDHQQYVRTVIQKISSIHDQNLPSIWRNILGRYEPNLIIVETPRRQPTFYVSPSEHSLDIQQQLPRLQFDDSSPTSINEKRQRCASASCASNHHVHSPVLAAPTTSTDDILSRTQSLSTKQRVRHSGMLTTQSCSFGHRQNFEHPVEDDEDDAIFHTDDDSMDPCPTQIPKELHISQENKIPIIDELVWNEHDFAYVPHFDFNDIVNEKCSPVELKRFDRLYQCYSSYEVFLTDQYKKIWENLWAKQKSHQKNLNDLQTTCEFIHTLKAETRRHLVDELKTYENELKLISDENALLGEKVVELTKITSRRKQSSRFEEETKQLRETERTLEQWRKDVNNDTLKFIHYRLELEQYENENKLAQERLENLKLITQNINHLKELNQQAEYQYLRLSDEVSLNSINPLPSSFVCVEEDEHQQNKSILSTTTNGRDENSEIDSVSFSEDHHGDETDQQQQQDEVQTENYDDLLNELIEVLHSQNSELSMEEIENQAYDYILDYMQTKADMQNFLLEHNTRYSELYLKAQEDYIKQMELELESSQSMLQQMQHVTI